MASKAAPDVLSLGLGLTSWVFPDLHVVIKVGLTLLVIGIVIFMRMDKSRQANTLQGLGFFFEAYLIPGFGGALRALLITLLLIMLTDLILNIHLIDNGNYYFISRVRTATEIFLHSLGNLTPAGNTILILGGIFGAGLRISETGKKNKVAESPKP